MNSRLDELQAAVLRVKLRHLDAENDRRRAIAARYEARLRGSAVRPPTVSVGSRHVFHQYVIRTKSRDTLRKRLRDRGVATAIHYPVAVHRQPAYTGRVPIPHNLAVTDRLVDEIVSLPVFPALSDADVDRVSEAILDLVRL
jgi:dTDP-4-amino-4,6-dideoxygalactose transaminase